MQTAAWCTAMVLTLWASSVAQMKEANKTVVINGKSAEVVALEVKGRTYVDLETLARVAQGSVAFRGNQVALTIPAGASPSPEISRAERVSPPGLSRDFIVSGIDTIAKMRDWATTLAFAIQHGYGVTESWVADYQQQAAQSLNLTSAAVSTDSDRKALQLLSNEFNAVQQWSNELVRAKATMDTAKYAMSPNALRDEPLSQKIITCGRFLGAMLGSAEFKDDGSCH